MKKKVKQKMSEEIKLSDKIIPSKYGNKEVFRQDEIREILGAGKPIDPRTLESLEDEGFLRGIPTTKTTTVYPRESLEDCLRKLHSNKLDRKR